MNPQFLIAKLAANATETAWAQSYSTLNFYVVLSVSSTGETDKSIAQIGKEMLERLQREYFALDEKTLEAIKKAVETVVNGLADEITYSLVLATKVDDTLYLVTASDGQALIYRNGKLGRVAHGTFNEIHGFSGPLKHDDIFILETADFAKRISDSLLQQSFAPDNLTDTAENLAPHLHEGALGTEATILLQYKNPEEAVVPTPIAEEEPEEQDDNTDGEVDKQTEPDAEDKLPAETEPELPETAKTVPAEKPVRTLPGLPIAVLLTKIRGNRKLIIVLGIIVLALILFGSIWAQTHTKKTAQSSKAVEVALTKAQSEYDEAQALESLNRPLALEKYSAAQQALETVKNKYPDSSEIDKVDALLSKLEGKVGEFSTGTKVDSGKAMLKVTDTKLKNFQSVTIKGGALAVANSTNTIATVEDSDVDQSDTVDAKALIAITGDEDTVYALANNGVYTFSRSNGDTDNLFKLDSGRTTIDIFGSNIYLLNARDKMIEKYSSSSYEATNYLKDDKKLNGTPISMAIDGSVYVLLADGTIKKYTRGTDDSFTLAGVSGKISDKGLLYTDKDFSNLYILDRTNQRLVVTSKSGEASQELSWDVFGKATDFAIDEGNKKGYVTTKDTLYSFDL